MQEAMQAAVGACQQAVTRAYLRVAGAVEEREAGVSHVLEVLGIVLVVVAIIAAIQALGLDT
ncbi:MAG TPA: hypothetical protein VFS29_10365, partial [Motilibacteraceae bacterium]|nr:hypothetical protein [Motilibacteraceae bacterium]